jgi:hypothetical protein
MKFSKFSVLNVGPSHNFDWVIVNTTKGTYGVNSRGPESILGKIYDFCTQINPIFHKDVWS